MSEIRVALVEDHDLTRIGIRTALQQSDELEFIGDAPNGKSGLKLILDTHPDLAIVDIGLPDMDGIEVTQRLKQAQEDDKNPTRVLILTFQDSEDAVLAAFAAGADSYCMKDINFDELLEVVKVTYEGNSWIDPAIAGIVLKQARQSQTERETADNTVSIKAPNPEVTQILEAYPLTDRELEVLELIVQGYNNAEISEKLYITVGTVKTHVRNILNKLCADDRTQAAVLALRSGLVG
jgi:DNA-binding NarL/FixJ family response regulator